MAVKPWDGDLLIECVARVASGDSGYADETFCRRCYAWIVIPAKGVAGNSSSLATCLRKGRRMLTSGQRMLAAMRATSGNPETPQNTYAKGSVGTMQWLV